MTKRIFALLLCVATLLASLTFVGCSEKDDEDKGQYITTYLTTNIYDLDPANAYNNEAVAKVVGLLFDTLFKLDDNGKVKKSLVDDYVIKENKELGEYKMHLYLKEDAKWSDGSRVQANDVADTWERLLETNHPAAALLFDIKGARNIKNGAGTLGDIGLRPIETGLLEIEFEGKIDYDQFILNLTSVALAPLRSQNFNKDADWAKKAGTIVCSGPFKLGRINMTTGHPDDEAAKFFDASEYEKQTGAGASTETTAATETVVETETAATTETTAESGSIPNDMIKYYYPQQTVTDFVIERNTYYYRDYEKDDLDKSVKPYKICVDCTLTDEQLTTMFDQGLIMYIGDIPLSLRKDSTIAKAAVVSDKSMSTNSIYFNQNALIANGTSTPVALFADANVRKALSMVIDRQAIADTVVYAKAANGLIPTGLFEAGSRKATFRDNCSATYSALTTNLAEAQALLANANLGDLGAYEINLTVAAYDDVHCYIAEEIVKAWQALGFTKASVKKMGTIANNDISKATGEAAPDICDDLYAEALRAGRFEAILFDYVAFSADPFSMLAPFARDFSGNVVDLTSSDESLEIPAHVTGYNNEDYNKLMETIFAEKYSSNRADLYRQAEAKLMEDMPIVPILFNLNASVTNANLKKVSVDYSGIANFRKCTIKGYDSYLDTGYKYLEDNFKPTEEQAVAIKDAWKVADPSDANVAVVDALDIMDMPINFAPSGSNKEAMLEMYKLHPMWNLKIIAAKDCPYTAWNFFRDSNSVYGHFFIKEKERLAEVESIADSESESISLAESLAQAPETEAAAETN